MISSPPETSVVSPNSVVVGLSDGRIVLFDSRTGEPSWTFGEGSSHNLVFNEVHGLDTKGSLKKKHSFRVYFRIFSARFEFIFASSPLVSSVDLIAGGFDDGSLLLFDVRYLKPLLERTATSTNGKLHFAEIR